MQRIREAFGGTARKQAGTAAKKSESTHARRSRNARHFRRYSAFSTCRSNSLDWICRSNPLDRQKRFRSAFTGCRNIDGHQMHQHWCNFYLPIRFQNMVQYWMDSRIHEGAKVRPGTALRITSVTRADGRREDLRLLAGAFARAVEGLRAATEPAAARSARSRSTAACRSWFGLTAGAGLTTALVFVAQVSSAAAVAVAFEESSRVPVLQSDHGRSRELVTTAGSELSRRLATATAQAVPLSLFTHHSLTRRAVAVSPPTSAITDR